MKAALAILPWSLLSCATTLVPAQSSRRVEVLENGLTVVSVDRPGLPLTTFALFLGRGAAHDPEPGLTRFALSTSWLGQANLSEDDVQRAIGDIGGEYFVDVQLDYAAVSLSCVSERAAEGLELLHGALIAPTLASATVTREVEKRRAEVAQMRVQPYWLGHDAFYDAVLGDHAYARAMRVGTPDDVPALSAASVREFLGQILRPQDAMLFVIGPRDDDLHATVRRRFASLPKHAKPPAPTPPTKSPDELSFHYVARPQLGQVRLHFGSLGLAANASSRPAHLVFQQLAASGFTSVLVDELRVNRGLIYSISLTQAWLEARAPFAFTTATQATNAAEVLRVTFAKLREISAGTVDDDRLEAARNTLLVKLAQRASTPWGQAVSMYESHRYNGDFDAFRARMDAVQSVTREQVVAAARCYDPGRLQVVLVGDPKELAALDLGAVR